MEETKAIMLNMLEDKKCLIMRNGIRIWLKEEEAKKFFTVLEQVTGSTFVQINGIVINTADVIGIFGEKEIEELAVSKGKNGGWTCKYDYPHDKGEYCRCENDFKGKLLNIASQNCKFKCNGGTRMQEVITIEGTALRRVECECSKEMKTEYKKLLASKNS